jgi:hypothetical protein
LSHILQSYRRVKRREPPWRADNPQSFSHRTKPACQRNMKTARVMSADTFAGADIPRPIARELAQETNR